MSPPLENGQQPGGQAPALAAGEGAEFSPEERRILLNLAHEAIASAIEQRAISPSLTPPSSHLAEPRGVFTTLYHHGALRGCVGYAAPTMGLCDAVAETARAAAFEDVRFPALSREELGGLEVSLSVLSPLQPIRPEQIEVGRHGLLIQAGGRRGLLLPQVPVEHGWDRVAFLQHTCRKAGLPLDAWQSGASLEAFTAEVFGDREVAR